MTTLNGGFFTTVRSVTGTPATATAMTLNKSLSGVTLPVYLRIRRPGAYPTDANSTVVRIDTATGNDVTAMTRNLTNGGMVNYPIQAGDEVYPDLGFLIEQLRASITALTSATGARQPGNVTGITQYASFTTLTGASAVVTPTVDCYALVIGNYVFYCSGVTAGDRIIGDLTVNGTAQLGTANATAAIAALDAVPCSQFWLVPLTANVAYTFQLRAATVAAGGTWNCAFEATKIIVQILASGVTV